MFKLKKFIRKNIFRLLTIVIVLILVILLSNPVSAQSQRSPIGPGKGSLENNEIIGQFIEWDRKSTPMLVLRILGASMLQTFSEISATGKFKIPLPEIPSEGNFGSMNCGDMVNGTLVVATNFSLLTTLPGFTSPGKWDKGYSVIGLAFLSDKYFSNNIGKPGGKRAQWLHSLVARTVEAGECNNTNSFPVEIGWNSFTVISGPSGGPHKYNTGLDEDLGWYWSAFPEDMTQSKVPNLNSSAGEISEQPVTEVSEIKREWLVGGWNGVQVDVLFKMRLQSSGEVWLESIENGNKKKMEGIWSLNNGEFVLEIKEGTLRFNIEQTSETSFQLFGKDASSDIVFTKKD